MQYAVIKSGGKQYKVSKGTVLDVDRLEGDAREVLLPDVLLFVSEGQVKIGKPYLSGVRVKASVVAEIKGDKIRVGKFKAKARYRRIMGFRASLTRLEIKDVVSDQKSEKSIPKIKEVKKTARKKLK